MAREYKDSGIEWIGEIPKEWKVTLSKRLFTIVAGATPKTDNVDLWDGDISWITPADYKTEDKFVCSGRRNLSEKGKNSCATYLLPTNSIVFSKRAPIGLVAITAKELCTNQGCLGCIPDGQLIVLFYYYAMSAFTEQFELLGTGTTFKEISATKFANFPFPYPPLHEQQKIAAYLDKVCGEVDEMIALQEQMIEELKAYKQSVITEAVTKGLNPKAPMKDSGIEWIGEIPEKWKIKPLKWILRKPLQYGANESGISFNESLPRYVRITDILNNTLREDLQKQSLTEEQAAGYILKDNDILFARSGGTVGKAFIYKSKYGRCAFAGYLIRAQIDNNNNSDYIYYYTQSSAYEEWKRQIFIQATIQNIGADRYSLLEIPLPPLSEQQSIASYLDTKCSEIDALIAIKQQKTEELKDYKKSVIYEYVTGKKEVN